MTKQDTTEIVVRRFIKADPTRVFQAWSHAGAMRLWMCPGPVTQSEVELDFRVGGSFRITMASGASRWLHTGSYRVIDAPRRLVFTWRSAATEDTDTEVEVLFEPVNDGTEIILSHRGLRDRTRRVQHGNGWADILAALERRIAGGDSDPETVVRRLYREFMGQGDVAAAHACWSPHLVDHDIPGIGRGGREEVMQAVLKVRSCMPDVVPTVERIFSQGQMVCVEILAKGTHTGAPFPPGIPASGKHIQWREIHIFRVDGGQIVEHWGIFDMFTILSGLGAIKAG